MKILEAIEITEAPVDGVLHNVRILNFQSKNNRLYDVGAVKKAEKLYEGAGVFLNHNGSAKISRDVRDKIGKTSNVRVTEAGVIGDLQLLTAHPAVPAIMEDFQKKTGVFCLSHEIDGDMVRQGGKDVVTNIVAVDGICVVDRGATTTTLREQEEMTGESDQVLIDGIITIVHGEGDMKAKLKKLAAWMKAHESVFAEKEETTETTDQTTEQPSQEKMAEELQAKVQKLIKEELSKMSYLKPQTAAPVQKTAITEELTPSERWAKL